MPPKKKKPNPERQAQFLAEVQRSKALRETTYRERALKIYPHVCASCGREFSGARLRELTVHHKDHDHMNNPPDGSNWELLCLYCHDEEHEKSGHYDEGTVERHRDGEFDNRPFAGLADLLPPEEDEPD